MYEQSDQGAGCIFLGRKQGKTLDWFKPYTKVKNTSFEGDVSHIKLVSKMAHLNVAHNCIDPASGETWRSGRDYLGRR